MIRLGFILVTFFIGFTLWSQSNSDTLNGKTYKELSKLIQINSRLDFEVATNLSTYYIERAKKEGNQKEEFNGLDHFIQVAIWSRKFDTFDDKYQRLLTLAEQNELGKELMRSHYLQAEAYFFQGVWSKATASYYKSLEIAKQLNSILFEHTILTRLGYLNKTTGDYVAALKFQKKALQLLENQPLNTEEFPNVTKNDLELQSLYYITISYIFSEDRDSARVYNTRALELNAIVQDSCLMRALYRQRAEIKLLENNFKDAIKDLEVSKRYCSPSTKGDSLVVSAIYGNAYLGLKQYDKAVEVLQKAVTDYNVQLNEEGFMQDHYKLLAKAYKYSGDIKNSNFYFEKYIFTTEEFDKIQDSVLSVFKQKEIEAFKNELNTIKSEKNQQQDYVLYIALAATLVILLLLFILLKFYLNKKKNDQKFQTLLSKLDLDKENASPKIIDTKDEILEEITTSDVSEEVTKQILDGLKKLESQEYFLKQDCNAYNVAKKIKTNTSYLSKVVNSHFQKNFNTYINDLRINYAIVRLKNDTRFRSFSIQSIAEELGYKSADSFTKYFKQDTGLNPSFYIKQLNQLH